MTITSPASEKGIGQAAALKLFDAILVYGPAWRILRERRGFTGHGAARGMKTPSAPPPRANRCPGGNGRGFSPPPLSPPPAHSQDPPAPRSGPRERCRSGSAAGA